MSAFLDIADENRPVTINGQAISVAGLSSAEIAALFRRFPDIQTALGGGEVDAARLVEIGPEALASIIAAGVGMAGDERAIAKAARLALHNQVRIAKDVMDMTWPGVIDPFVKKIEAIAANYLAAIESASNESESAASPAPNSRKRSKN